MNDNPTITLAERFARKTSPSTGVAATSPVIAADDATEGYQAFKVGGDHRFEVMVTFKLHDGNFRALGYSYLVGLAFDPSKNLVMKFSGGDTVTITGRNLTPLFKALAAHKVVWIWEVDPLADPTEDAATVVNQIEFAEKL